MDDTKQAAVVGILIPVQSIPLRLGHVLPVDISFPRDKVIFVACQSGGNSFETVFQFSLVRLLPVSGTYCEGDISLGHFSYFSLSLTDIKILRCYQYLGKMLKCYVTEVIRGESRTPISDRHGCTLCIGTGDWQIIQDRNHNKDPEKCHRKYLNNSGSKHKV